LAVLGDAIGDSNPQRRQDRRRDVDGAAEGPLRVLIADDDEHFRLLIREILSDQGIDVWEAAEGSQALRLVRSVDPDVALLDWLMPNGGLQLARTLIAEYQMTERVIMLSGLVDPRDQRQALEAGVVAYITKPPPREKLVMAVRQAGVRSRASRPPPRFR
jgi:CheY-like chemotaxis protein